jgi:holin-like protein
MIQSLFILLLFLFIGDGLSDGLHLFIPGNVIGMVLLTVSLQFKLVKLEWVRPASDALLKNMALLFIPAGVGLMLYLDLLRESWLPIGAGILVSSFIVLSLVGAIQQKLEKAKGGA